MSGSPRGLRLNNPGNIRKNAAVTYKGETVSTDPAFKQFIGLEYGYRALASLLLHYVRSGGLNTISKIIHTYAPAADQNNPDSYTNFVAMGSGIGPNAILTEDDFKQLPGKDANMLKIIRQISRVEQGQMPDEVKMRAGYDLFLSDNNLA